MFPGHNWFPVNSNCWIYFILQFVFWLKGLVHWVVWGQDILSYSKRYIVPQFTYHSFVGYWPSHGWKAWTNGYTYCASPCCYAFTLPLWGTWLLICFVDNFFAYPKSVCVHGCPLNLPDVCDLEFPLSREALSLMNVHWQAFSDNFTGLELEDGGGRGTSGCLSFFVIFYF